jgi:hypothetical protein
VAGRCSRSRYRENDTRSLSEGQRDRRGSRADGNIPEVFLRGCGVADEVIAYVRSLGQSANPIELYSCFISYSSKDQEFCERLLRDLRAKPAKA